MKIFGVEILNEGSGVSIDDAVTEMQATFVARFVELWSAVASPFTGYTRCFAAEIEISLARARPIAGMRTCR